MRSPKASRARATAARPPDPEAMAAAARAFLVAAGIDPRDPECVGTPERVARAWCESFLDGYAARPEEILGETLRAEGSEPVVLRGISFHSMCPHHLLPFSGVAHVAFVPRARSVGFSRIVRLVDCFAHRLNLQERIAHQVADALVAHLGAVAAACALDAEQGCMSLQGVKRAGSRVWTEATAGDRRWRSRLRALLAPSFPKKNHVIR